MKEYSIKELYQHVLQRRSAFALIGLFWLLCCIVMYLTHQGKVIDFFVGYRSTVSNYFMMYATTMGEGIIYTLAILIFLFYDLNKSLWLTILGAVLLSCVFLLKFYFGHPRPSIYLKDFSLENYLISGWEVLRGYNSFPSAHTAAAFGIYTFLAMLVRNKWIAFYSMVIAILVAISRVYLAQHFVEDVLVGSIIGLFIGLFVYYLYKRFYARDLRCSLPEFIRRYRAGDYSSSSND